MHASSGGTNGSVHGLGAEEYVMTAAHLDAVVRLKEDVPACRLRRDDVGVVVSIWLSSGEVLFGVEFRKQAESAAVRAMLREEQLEVVEPHS